jgi:hypothetical protein
MDTLPICGNDWNCEGANLLNYDYPWTNRTTQFVTGQKELFSVCIICNDVLRKTKSVDVPQQIRCKKMNSLFYINKFWAVMFMNDCTKDLTSLKISFSSFLSSRFFEQLTFYKLLELTRDKLEFRRPICEGDLVINDRPKSRFSWTLNS